MPLFVMSAKVNVQSEMALESTYLGKDAIEVAHYLSKTIPFENLDSVLVNRGYLNEASNTYSYEYIDEKYLVIKFSKEINKENLVRVVAKIYSDNSKNKLEVQYESLLFWNGGIS